MWFIFSHRVLYNEFDTAKIHYFSQNAKRKMRKIELHNSYASLEAINPAAPVSNILFVVINLPINFRQS